MDSRTSHTKQNCKNRTTSCLHLLFKWLLAQSQLLYENKIRGIGKLLRKVDKVILCEFILTITGGIIITENKRKLLSLAPRLRGLVYQYLKKKEK